MCCGTICWICFEMLNDDENVECSYPMNDLGGVRYGHCNYGFSSHNSIKSCQY